MGLETLNRLPFAPLVGAMFAAVAAILTLATPDWLFAEWVVASGLPGVIGAAAPPLGVKAQLLAAIAAAIIVGCLLWLVITPFERPQMSRVLSRGTRALDSVPLPGEALKAAPKPILAGEDLGAPFMSDEAMAFAKDELMLDPAMIDVAPAPIADAPASVSDMVTRLETALERRSERVGSAPPTPGDIGSLRTALGLAA